MRKKKGKGALRLFMGKARPQQNLVIRISMEKREGKKRE